MIHLTRDDACCLFARIHPIGASHCGFHECHECPIDSVCTALHHASFPTNLGNAVSELFHACALYREYTDAVCDTYSCPNCPNYSWCTTLRGIAIEGVKLNEY